MVSLVSIDIVLYTEWSVLKPILCSSQPVTDLDSVRAALSDGEGEWKAVFHGAGVIAYSSKMSNLMQSVNVDGTRNVISAIKEVRKEKRHDWHPTQKLASDGAA